MSFKIKFSKYDVSKTSGFTVIELITSIGLLLLIAAITTPIVANMYASQQNQAVTEEIISTLRRAQFNATLNKDDTRHGVRFTNGNFILFSGYFDVNNPSNQIFDLSINEVSLNPAPEDYDVIFARFTGFLSEDVDQIEITVSGGNRERQIFVCRNGLIDLVACDVSSD